MYFLVFNSVNESDLSIRISVYAFCTSCVRIEFPKSLDTSFINSGERMHMGGKTERLCESENVFVFN